MDTVVFDKGSSKMVLSFSTDGSAIRLEMLAELVRAGKFKEGPHPDLGYLTFREKAGRIFYVCYSNLSNRKAANYRLKLFMAAMNDFLSYREYERDLYSKVFEFAFHNSRNIHHTLLSTLQRVLGKEDLLHNPDKVAHVRNVLTSNPVAAAREILNTVRSLEQVDFEYDIIDFLKPGTHLSEQDFTDTKVHTLLVMAFYIFEKEFSDRKIRVNIAPCAYSVRGSFFTLRSAFSLLLENCVKYCRPGTEIGIEYSDLPKVLKIDIEMNSVYNEDGELEKVFIPGNRGQNAQKCSTKGEGLGLFVSQKLFSLNGISLNLRRIDNSPTLSGDIQYCRNLFVVDIPRERLVK